MAEYLSPGIFIEEIAAGPRVIQGVATSSMGIVGYTAMGPVDEATLCTSFGGFQSKFGGFVRGKHVPTNTAAFFANSGSRAYVVRTVASDAALADVTIPTSLFTFNCVSKGAWGNDLRVVVENNDNYLDYSTGKCTKHNVYVQLKDSEGNYNTVESFAEVVLTDPDDPAYMPEVVNAGSDYVTVPATPRGDDIPDDLNGTAQTMLLGTGDAIAKTFTGTITAGKVPAMKRSLVITLQSNTNLITDDGAGNLTGTLLDPAGPNTINYTTGAYALKFLAAPPDTKTIDAAFFKLPVAESKGYDLTTGSDGTAGVTRNEVSNSSLEVDRRGIYALDRVDEILQLCLPDFAGNVTVSGDQITFAESRKDRFVILTTPMGLKPQDAVDWVKYQLQPNSSYAALYYPWITISDPISGLPTNVPPLGHVAGVYARTDSAKNVGKSPGGLDDGKLNYAIGLERVLDKGERDILYPQRINPLISTPLTGLCVWGVRTLALDSLWRYINARRLLMFLEKSTFNATHWVVFENNGADLRAKVSLQLQGFLLILFGDGYFAGNAPAEAFFIQCDDKNNPPEVVNAGQLICDIGVAPNKPAEFVRFRFQQKTAS